MDRANGMEWSGRYESQAHKSNYLIDADVPTVFYSTMCHIQSPEVRIDKQRNYSIRFPSPKSSPVKFCRRGRHAPAR